jgi:hypothetical protein
MLRILAAQELVPSGHGPGVARFVASLLATRFALAPTPSAFFFFIFSLKRKKRKKIMMWLLSRVRVDGCGHDGLGGNM